MEAAGGEDAISFQDEAVDKNIFKDCSKIGFYRRQKLIPRKNTYRALLDSVTSGKDSTKFQIINEVNKIYRGIMQRRKASFKCTEKFSIVPNLKPSRQLSSRYLIPVPKVVDSPPHCLLQHSRPFVCKPFSMDPEYLKDNVMQLRHRDQNLGDLDTLMEEEARVQEVPQDLTIRQHSTWWEAEETDVSHLPIKTENDEEPVDQTPGYSQDFTCNTSCSFLKEEDVPLSPSMATVGVSCKAEPENDTCQSPSFLPFSSSKAHGDGPNQPPPRRIRQRRRSLANTISAEMARNRRLTWDLARRSEAHLDRLIAIGERANAQREVDNSLRRESVIAVNQLATTVEGAISALHQFNELLDHSLNPGKS